MSSKPRASIGRPIPFQFVEKDGYAYGRGTQDMKDGDAIYVTTLIRFAQERLPPGSRHHPRAHRRRRGRRFEWRRLAAAQSSRPDRRRSTSSTPMAAAFTPQDGKAGDDVRRRQRKNLRRLSARSEQCRRPQLVARPRQRDLSPHRRASRASSATSSRSN